MPPMPPMPSMLMFGGVAFIIIIIHSEPREKGFVHSHTNASSRHNRPLHLISSHRRGR